MYIYMLELASILTGKQLQQKTLENSIKLIVQRCIRGRHYTQNAIRVITSGLVSVSACQYSLLR